MTLRNMDSDKKNTEKKFTLIVEPLLSGHHKTYLINIVKALQESGRNLLVVIPEELVELNIDGVCVCKYSFDVFDGAGGLLNLIRREVNMWLALRKIYRKFSGERNITDVFIPYLDYFLYAVAIFGSPFNGAKFSGITMRPAFHYNRSGVRAPYRKIDMLKEFLFGKLIKSKEVKCIYTIDGLLLDYVESNFHVIPGKIRYLPDPVEYNFNAVSVTKKNELLTLTVFGAIDERKGILELADSLRYLNGSIRLVLAGIIKPEVKSMLDSILKGVKNIQIHELNRWIGDDEINEIFDNTDIVWLGYRDHFTMSGVLIQAGVRGKYVIGCRSGLIGWYVEKYKMGAVLELKPQEIAAVLNELIVNGVEHSGYDAQIFETHNWQNFKSIILNDGGE